MIQLFNRFYLLSLSLFVSPIFCSTTQYWQEIRKMQDILRKEVYPKGENLTKVDQQHIDWLIEKMANYTIGKYCYLSYKKIKDRYEAVRKDIGNRANNPQSLQDLQKYLDEEYEKRDQRNYLDNHTDYRPWHGGVHSSIALLLLENIMPFYKQYWNKKEEIRELKQDPELYILSKLAILFHDTHNTSQWGDVKDLNCVFFEHEMKKAGFDPKKIERVSDALSKKDARPLNEQSIQTAGIHDCDCTEIIRISESSFTSTLSSAIKSINSFFGKNHLTIYSLIVEKEGKEKAIKIIDQFIASHTKIAFHFMKNDGAIRDQCQKNYDHTYTATCQEIQKCNPNFKLPYFNIQQTKNSQLHNANKITKKEEPNKVDVANIKANSITIDSQNSSKKEEDGDAPKQEKFQWPPSHTILLVGSLLIFSAFI